MSSAEAIPAVMIALPLVAAVFPLLLGLRWDEVGWSVAAGITPVLLVLALRLGAAVRVTGRIVHPLAGFDGPVGIELVVDELSMLVAVLITLVATAVLGFARHAGPRRNAFYSAYLLLTGGLLGVAFTGDVFNMFVFLEITGLATYAMIASDRSPTAAVAALKYLILGTVGASFFLIGVGYVFLATGTLNMADLQASIGPDGVAGYDDILVQTGFAFIVVALAVKSAIFPLHTWQPDAYRNAPDSVTAYISALVSTVAAYALARMVYSVFTVEFFEANPIILDFILGLATISVLAGSALAVMQSEIKRMLAYSSVSQFGLVFVGIALGVRADTAVYGAVIHLLGHGIIKGGLFVAAGTLAAATGARTVGDYAALGKRRPVAAGAMAILGLALVGVPPTVGFVGKWYIAVGAIEAGAWPVALVVFLSTMLTLAYVARLLERLYFVPAEDTDWEMEDATVQLATDGGRRASTGMVAVAVGAALAAVALGFMGETFVSWLEPWVLEVMA